MSIQEGDYILLYLTHEKRWLIKFNPESKIHTHAGYIEGKNISGLRYGDRVESSMRREFWVLKPTISDFVLKTERKTQVVYPKDLGYIAAKTGLAPGFRVVEAGTGSGAFTMFLANIVKPDGHVFTYELRKEFMEIAQRNLKKSGLTEYVTMKLGDAQNGFEVSDADLAIIDVGDPWTLIEPAWKSLRGSGMIVTICPTMNQVEKTAEELRSVGFIDVEADEVLTRSIQAKLGMTRPSMRMIGHTTYLVFGRKIFRNIVEDTIDQKETLKE